MIVLVISVTAEILFILPVCCIENKKMPEIFFGDISISYQKLTIVDPHLAKWMPQMLEILTFITSFFNGNLFMQDNSNSHKMEN